MNTTPPSISGTPKPGQTLTASPGAWANEPSEFVYRWERCDPSGTSCVWTYESEPNTHLVAPEEVDNTIRVQVKALNEAGTSEAAVSAPLGIEPAWEYGFGVPEVRPVPWSPLVGHRHEAFFSGRVLSIGIGLPGYCSGETPPAVDHIEVVEAPSAARRRFNSALVTAYVRFAPREVVGTVNKGEPGPGCAGLGQGRAVRQVKLKRPVGDLFVFDASRSPPRLLVQAGHRRGAPRVEGEWASHVTSTGMTLEAEIETGELETTYQFGLTSSPACRRAQPPCEISQQSLPLPSKSLAPSPVAQCVSLDLDSRVALEPGGEYKSSITATNAAGNGRRSGPLVALSDSPPQAEAKTHCPVTAITETKSAATGSRHRRLPYSARFRFTADGTANRFECMLSDRRPGRHAAFTRCLSPKTFRHLAPGTYRFEVRGLNANGADATPAIKTVQIR